MVKNSRVSAQESVQTVSHPERPAYILIIGLHCIPVAVILMLWLTSEDEFSTAWLSLTLGIVAAAIVLCVTMVKVLVVHTHATAEDGLRLSLHHFVSRTLPWEAIDSISRGPTGGAMDVGWKWMGGGRVGYLAGAENVIVKINPELRQRVLDGEVQLPESPKVAEWYYVSVPDPDVVAVELNRLRARALG